MNPDKRQPKPIPVPSKEREKAHIHKNEVKIFSVIDLSPEEQQRYASYGINIEKAQKHSVNIIRRTVDLSTINHSLELSPKGISEKERTIKDLTTNDYLELRKQGLSDTKIMNQYNAPNNSFYSWKRSKGLSKQKA